MRAQLRKGERLPHQIVGAQIERLHAILGACVVGQNQDWQTLLLGTHVPQHVESVGIREVQIEDRSVVFTTLRHRLRLFAIRRQIDSVIFRIKAALKKRTERSIILSDKNPHGPLPAEGKKCERGCESSKGS